MLRDIFVKTHLKQDRSVRLTVSTQPADQGDLSIMRRLAAGEMDLSISANGHVWILTTSDAEKPDHELTVVSMPHLTDGIQYRLVGENASAYPHAFASQPGLEDGYVWLMKSAGHELEGI